MIEDLSPMHSGRKLDALVAEHVMGWQRQGNMLGPPLGDKRISWATEWNVDTGLPDYLPRYSLDPADMWEIIKHLEGRYDFIDIQFDCGSWFCLIKTFTDDDWLTLSKPIGRSTAMKAVCYAALEAEGYIFEGRR